MKNRWIWLCAAGLALSLGACGDDDGSDGGRDTGDDTSAACDTDAACDDAVFCNGAERCTADGCTAGTPPCTGACDEASGACTDCEDADGDGQTSATCGGEDCDDEDPDRFLGNVEICDAEAIDEDCDPTTFGTDADGDGFFSDECCNGSQCGRDCDDTRAGVNPSASDGCGGGDQDCDGTVDEEPDSIFFRDQDSDNFGTDDDTLAACSQPSGYVARGGDCSDDPFADANANMINPGATEICNAFDDNCDLRIDEDLTCMCTTPGTTQPCDFDPSLDGVGICVLGLQTCQPDGTFSVCAGATSPIDEICNLTDDDCDGATDEGTLLNCWFDGDRDTYAAAGATLVVACMCPDQHTERNPSAVGSADCDDGSATVFPGAPETCNRVDDDCSGGTAHVAEDSDRDGHTEVGFAGCTGGFPKDDCFDQHNEVYTGQTEFFGTPYCPGDLCVCGMGCKARDALGRCSFCSIDNPGTPGLGSWDYTCDGNETPVNSRSSCGICFSGAACLGDQTRYGSPTPACGSSVEILHCGTGGCSGGCDGAGATTMGPLECR